MDSEGDVGGYISLALDGAGRPHISYYDDYYYNNGDLKYAWHNGSAWQIETVDSEGDVGKYNSLALDGLGWPHISYYYRGPLHSWNIGDLKYAWHDGTNWQIETVDSEGRVGVDTSLALDGAGRPHISYYDYDNTDLKYAWHDGTDWQIETVASWGRVGYDTSLALDGAGRPHISYYADYVNSDLKYARHDGTAWQIETVDHIAGPWTVGGHTSLALDGASRPHISYSWIGYSIHGSWVIDMKYAGHNGTDWQTETVASEEDVGTYSSLALDGMGRPHISYYDRYGYNGDLKYAWHNGSAWQIETVDSEGWVGEYTSLALDGAGRPHISYFDVYPNRDLKYAWHDGTAWQIETVDSEGWVGEYTSLALDGAGRPHISYYDNDNQDLKYAWHNGSAWQIETVDSEDAVGSSTSLALDGAGRPHISYYDSTNGDLKYAWLMPPLLLDKQATPSDGLRNNDVLTYTLTIFSPGLSVRLWDPLPPPVRYVFGSITSTIAPPAVYSPTVHAVIWQGTLPTDTVQVIHFQVTAGVTGTAGSLMVPIVNTAWLTDTTYGRSISAIAIVNGSHIYLPLVLR